MKILGLMVGRLILLRVSITNQLPKLHCIHRKIVICLLMFLIMQKLGHGSGPVSYLCVMSMIRIARSRFLMNFSLFHSAGLPNTFTGIPDFKTVKEADNCWEWAPHQWFNQGCVAVSSEEGTLGKPLNSNGGGVYALEWDPANLYIRSWVFTPHESTPQNILDVIRTSSKDEENERIKPDPNLWGLPYAYFAIGDGTGCSADHFKNIRIVFNLAFCGTVAGNRFFGDCPIEAQKFNVSNDPVATCNAYIHSDSEGLNEAYWNIKGLYIYEREMITNE
jgi:hypothetical protein